MHTFDIPLQISWFESAIIRNRPALGDPENTTWGKFCSVFWHRREGAKDGPCFCPARFRLEADGRHVRRKNTNVTARSAIALDIEPNKSTGEIPPEPQTAIDRLRAAGVAGLVYTSHSHRPPDNIRYRVVMPLSAEVPPELPACQIMATRLRLEGVLDGSKSNPAAVFYLPSCENLDAESHLTEIIDGAPVDATGIMQEGAAILAAQEAEAQAAAAARAAARLEAGANDEAQLIEKIRALLDLESILRAHGYAKSGQNFRHPNSSSGCFGANIKTLGGVERVFSHNATDPLYRDNLPDWCAGVTAIDAFDATAILDFGGDRTKALRQLGEQFHLTKGREKKALSKLLFKMIRLQKAQNQIEETAFAEGQMLGLSRDEIKQVAGWVVQQAVQEAA